MEEAKENLQKAVIEYLEHVSNWPTHEGEPVDLENCNLLAISFVAGGDWQRSHLIQVDLATDAVSKVVKGV